MKMWRRWAVIVTCLVPALSLAATLGGPLPGPLPLFPSDNWWNQDISTAPVDPNSAAFINFIGPTRGLHPDFGGEEFPGSVRIYGMPYIVVNISQPKKTVQFYYPDESDGVDQGTGQSYPFYPIPDEAITEPHWIEGGEPGNETPGGDRHMLIVDADNKYLYELFDVSWSGGQWYAGSGAFFDMNTNNRRPEGWTSADAAGLAILSGLVRYDEVYGPDEIRHAFRVTVRATNGYVWPASHRAGSTAGALPMGARLRLKASKDISGFDPTVQKIFRAMKKYGLIVADNGTDMYVTGTFDTRWNNDILNPAFAALKASDFEVVQLGWMPSPSPPAINSGGVVNGASFAPGTPLAPGSIVSAFGSNLATATAFAGALPLPLTLDGATLEFNGSLTVPKFYASPTHINFQLPWELAGVVSASLTDSVDGSTSGPETVNLATFAPGLFATNQAGTGQGAILISGTGGRVAAPVGMFPGSRPVIRGTESIEIFCTGLGPVTNQPPAGSAAGSSPLSLTTTTPFVNIGGAPAAVSFSGLAPGFVGLYQVNAQVPAGVPTGDAVPVVVTIGGIISNSVTIAVQ